MRSILYGNDWEQRATKLPSIGIMIAPEIFRVTERIYFQNGKAVMEGTQYFDWETAHQLVENHNVPAGWRMMKPAEARKIEELYNACQFDKLVLGHDGYVVPPMARRTRTYIHFCFLTRGFRIATQIDEILYGLRTAFTARQGYLISLEPALRCWLFLAFN